MTTRTQSKTKSQQQQQPEPSKRKPGVLQTAIESGNAKIITKQLQGGEHRTDHYHVVIKFKDGNTQSFSNVSKTLLENLEGYEE